MPDEALRRVVWIGGSTCAGKTSISERIAQRFALQVYHFDHHEPQHIERLLRQGDEALARFLEMSLDERWLLRSPTIAAQDTIGTWTRRFALVLEDVRAIAQHGPVIVEGAGLFPECVAPLLSSVHQALWLIPTFAFIQAVRRGRTNGVAYQTSDPERSLRMIARRDFLLAQHVRREAQARRLPVRAVNGRVTLDEMTERVARHVAPVLSRD